MNRAFFVYISFFLLVVGLTQSNAQPPANYDESKVGSYTLPDLLINSKGEKVESQSDWNNSRRREILQLFKDNVYGQFPPSTKDLHFSLISVDSGAMNGVAIVKQVRIYFQYDTDGPFTDLLLILPAKIKKPVPVFLGLNFRGNHTVIEDEIVEVSENYIAFLQAIKKSSSIVRGEHVDRWSVKELLENGYGLATAYYGDVEQDYPDGWKTGIRTSLSKVLQLKPEQWSAIGAWAWQLSRILDYLQTDADVDASKVIVNGHSRLGKAALWAGANDSRFAAVISNESGEGGAALTRRNYGETLATITKAFPHWFIPKYKTYAGKESQLPVDQHMLLALIAPRPLYVASAVEDQWSDPYGELLSAKNAEPVYNLFLLNGLGTDQMPAPNTSIGKAIRYHIRTGKHDILWEDWKHYIKFADDLVK